MRKTRASTAALSVAAVTLGVLAPAAGAATLRVSDPAETGHGSDLRAVRVVNGDHEVRVRTTHTNLRRDWRSGTSGAVYLDTDPRDRGPEFVFVGGYYEGADYQLLHTEDFGHKHWGSPVRGSYEMRIDYAHDHVTMRISRAALGRPEKVRVAVKAGGTRSDGTSRGLVDWLGTPRSWTPWVARG